MSKVTPFFMFADRLAEAVEFYTTTFPDSKVIRLNRGASGEPAVAEFVVGGQHILAYEGGSYFQFSQGISLFVSCEDQKEVDLYWEKILAAGGKEVQCGWITDRFGLSWQIVPRRFMELIQDPDPKKVKAVMDAMMQMVKFDVAGLEKAYREA